MKKWSYVAALMLTAASGLSLTSCIDNDEPYGIEQIRIATASLLEAKKSAVNAEQAANEAKIEIAKIELQIKQLEAENQKILNEAQAKIAEAEAKAIELRAQAEAALSDAEALRLKAEAEKLLAQAEEQKAQTEMYKAEQQAKIDEYIAQAEIRVNKAQLEYETTLYYFQQEQAKNADKATSRLYKAWETAFKAYIEQLGVVNSLTDTYLKALKDYNRAAIDLIPGENDGEWVSPNYNALASLKRNVADIQAQIDNANDKIAKFQEVIANLQNVTTSDLYQLFEKYEAEAKANDAELDQAGIDKAALAIENKELAQSIKDLQAQVDMFNSKKIDIPAYTWDPKEIDEAAFASIGITESVEVVPERESYTLGNEYNYNKAVANYTDLINKLKYYLMDANDVAWTQARINEMKNKLTLQQTAYETAKANWENAKKAYNNGNEPDYSVIPMEADVEKAVAAFNASSAEYSALRETYLNAEKAYNEAQKKANDLDKAFRENPNSAANKLATARQAYQDARQANQNTYEQAIAAANEAYSKATAPAENDLAVKQRDLAAKKNIYLTLLGSIDDPENADLKKAKKDYEDALAAVDQAETALNTAVEKASKTRNDAYLKARTAQITADQKANEVWVKAQADFTPAANDVSKDPEAKAWLAAVDAADEAWKTMDKAWNAYNDQDAPNSVWAKYYDLYNACFDQWDAVGGGNWDYETSMNILYSKLYGFITESDENLEFPVAVAPSHDFDKVDGGYVNVKAYLINMSGVAYGWLGVDYDKNNGIFEYDEAFLIDAAEITPAMVNEYIKTKFPADDEFDYYAYYDLFGAYGQTLYTQNRIDVATAMINNQKLLSESIEPLQAGVDALEEGNEAAKKEGKELEYALEDKQAEWNNLEAEIDAKIANLQGWKSIYSELLGEITSVIAKVEEIDTNGEMINKYIEETIAKYEKKIEKQNKAIEEYNEWLAQAQYQLDQYVNNEGVMTANPEEINLAVATANLNAAQEELAFLKARAEELEAKYKAANQ